MGVVVTLSLVGQSNNRVSVVRRTTATPSTSLTICVVGRTRTCERNCNGFRGIWDFLGFGSVLMRGGPVISPLGFDVAPAMLRTISIPRLSRPSYVAFWYAFATARVVAGEVFDYPAFDPSDFASFFSFSVVPRFSFFCFLCSHYPRQFEESDSSCVRRLTLGFL